MKLLLTSQMIHNKSIANALAELMDKPFSESTVTYIITSHNGAKGDKSWFVHNLTSVHDLHWKNFYMIDVAGLNGLASDSWMEQIEKSDVIVMGGGANYFLSYWLENSGLLSKLPKLLQTKVYVSSSAGSMLMQEKLCTSSEAIEQFADGNWNFDEMNLGPAGRSSNASLGLVDFLIRPHYGTAMTAVLSDELMQQISSPFGKSLYVLDDDSALKVVDGRVTIVSEGNWKLIEP